MAYEYCVETQGPGQEVFQGTETEIHESLRTESIGEAIARVNYLRRWRPATIDVRLYRRPVGVDESHPWQCVA
jgi:hypothetical protein